MVMISSKSYTFEEALNATKNFRSKEVSVSESVAKFLYNCAKLVAGKDVIVETGAFIGYATIFLGFGSSTGNGVKVHSIDPWGLPPSSMESRRTYQDKLRISRKTFDEFLQNIKEAGLENLIIHHRAYAHTYSRVWPRNLTIGLLVIDGDHSEWGAYADYFLYSKYLADGATVIFHDFGDGSVERAVSRIDKSKIRDGLILGTGYESREAFAFKYIKSNRKNWLEKTYYYELSLRNRIKKTFPVTYKIIAIIPHLFKKITGKRKQFGK